MEPSKLNSTNMHETSHTVSPAPSTPATSTGETPIPVPLPWQQAESSPSYSTPSNRPVSMVLTSSSTVSESFSALSQKIKGIVDRGAHCAADPSVKTNDCQHCKDALKPLVAELAAYPKHGPNYTEIRFLESDIARFDWTITIPERPATCPKPPSSSVPSSPPSRILVSSYDMISHHSWILSSSKSTHPKPYPRPTASLSFVSISPTSFHTMLSHLPTQVSTTPVAPHRVETEEERLQKWKDILAKLIAAEATFDVPKDRGDALIAIRLACRKVNWQGITVLGADTRPAQELPEVLTLLQRIEERLASISDCTDVSKHQDVRLGTQYLRILIEFAPTSNEESKTLQKHLIDKCESLIMSSN